MWLLRQHIYNSPNNIYTQPFIPRKPRQSPTGLTAVSSTSDCNQWDCRGDGSSESRPLLKEVCRLFIKGDSWISDSLVNCRSHEANTRLVPVRLIKNHPKTRAFTPYVHTPTAPLGRDRGDRASPKVNQVQGTRLKHNYPLTYGSHPLHTNFGKRILFFFAKDIHRAEQLKQQCIFDCSKTYINKNKTNQNT